MKFFSLLAKVKDLNLVVPENDRKNGVMYLKSFNQALSFVKSNKKSYLSSFFSLFAMFNKYQYGN